jgi:hypothetical protein
MRDDSVQQPINCSTAKLNSVKVRLSKWELNDELAAYFLCSSVCNPRTTPLSSRQEIEIASGLALVEPTL